MLIDDKIMSLKSGDIFIVHVDTYDLPKPKARQLLRKHLVVLRELIPNKKIRILVFAKKSVSFSVIRSEV
jgi:hypothetical protein